MDRDDEPYRFSLNRRQLLVAGGLLVGGVVLSSPSLPTSASSSVDPALKQTPFMSLSALLIQHRLDANVGGRLAKAMAFNDPAFAQHVDGLLVIARTPAVATVEEWFPRIPEGPLKTTALAIVSAWYVGVIVDVPNAEVYAYELALLFQPTIDVMTIPTFAISGPNGWNAEAPPLAHLPNF